MDHNNILDSVFNGNFKSFKESVTSALFSKIASRLDDTKCEVAKEVFAEEKESKDVEYKERVNHSDKDGYPEDDDDDDDDEDDTKGGEFLVDLKMVGVDNTELENFRVVGTSKADVESRLDRFFGKGKYEIKNIKLDEGIIKEEVEKIKIPVGNKPKGIGWELHRAGEQHNESNNIWKRTTKKVATPKEPTVSEQRFEKGEDIGQQGLNFKKIAKKAGAEYGSEEAGERVAGSILKKILKKKHKKKVSEEIEFIDEVKGSTLTSYIEKAGKEKIDMLGKPYNTAPEPKDTEKYAKRSHGLKTALKKVEKGDYQEASNPPEEAPFNKYLKGIGLNQKKYNTSPKDMKTESVNELQSIAKVAQSIEECSTYNGDYDYHNGDKDKEYATTHKSFSDAIESAKKHAMKSGYKHDPLEFDEIVNKGFINPKENKSHVFHMSLYHDKDGQEVLNKIHSFQITGHGNGKFTLNQDIK